MTHPLVHDVWVDRWQDQRRRLWLRVVSYAYANANQHGHCVLTHGELARALDRDSSQISKAIAQGVAEAMLHPVSSARCLVLDGADPLAPCPALHKDGC